MNKIYLLILLVIAIFTACDAEFDPNDDYQEKMIVCSLLDQDDDTTFVRVEKCFAGNGNAVQSAKNKDSLYYPASDLRVRIYAYDIWNPEVVKDTLEFKYMQTTRTSSDFYSGEDCPVYYCETKQRLNLWYNYKLEVLNLKTQTKVSSQTYLLADYTIKNSTFVFYEKDGSNNDMNNKMNVEWTNVDNSSVLSQMVGKQYQITVRFNYVQNGKIKHLDIPLIQKTNEVLSSVTMSAYITIGDIATAVQQHLKGQSALKWYAAAPFELKVEACDLSLFDYLSINNASLGILDYKPIYSNIEGGIGVFASRRTHVSREFPDDKIDGTLKKIIAEMEFFQ